MSISNLFAPNPYNLFAQTMSVNTLNATSVDGPNGGPLLLGEDSIIVKIGNDAIPKNQVYINGLRFPEEYNFGAQGDIGPTGPQGPQGNQGPTGPQGPGISSIGAISGSNTNGLVISGSTLHLSIADATNGGAITSSAQTFAGLKTFNSGLAIPASVHLQNTVGDNIIWTANDPSSIYIGKTSGASSPQTGVQQNNVCVGLNTLSATGSGLFNICIGSNAGIQYTSTEGSNICIGSAGVIGDQYAIRIGQTGNYATCAIQGIYGNSPASPQVVISDSAGNLGTQTISSISGVTTMAAVGAVPNANGAVISGNTLTLEPADATHAGVITTGTQTFAGSKIFNNGLSIPNTGNAINGIGSTPILWQGAGGVTSNIFVGRSAGNATTGSSARDVGVGQNALLLNTSGLDNTACGFGALGNITTANACTALGSGAGSVYTTEAGANIVIGNAGATGDVGHIRIGTVGTHTASQIAGIYGNSPASSQYVIIDSNGNLGSTNVGGSGVTTMAAIGSSPNANGASISGTTLTMQPASASFGGVLTASSQTIAGAKTWSNDATFSANINFPRTANPTSTAGIFNVNGSRFLHTSGATGSATNVYMGLNCANVGVSNTSSNCIGIGQGTLGGITSGNSNVAVGSGAGLAITSGSNNVAIGQDAGSTILATGVNNIHINNIGNSADTNTIRIGTHATQTQTFISGIVPNTTVVSTSSIVTADTATSKMGILTYVQNAAYTTSNIQLDGGAVTINAMTIRGVAQSSPWPYPITYCQIGQIIFMKLPAFQVTSKTGVDPTDILLAISVPVGLRPTLADASHSVSAQDSGNFDDAPYKIIITTGGEVHFVPSTGSNFTTNFGLQEDTTITYTL